MSDIKSMHEECDTHDCFLPTDRRQFLRNSFFAVAGALVAAGATSSAALAMPMAFTESTKASGSMRSYAIPTADGAQIDKENQLILVRWQDAIYAFALSCPHQNTALRWDEGDHSFQCPKHHSKFTVTGDYIAGSGRATRNMDRLAIRRDGSGIAVDVDTLYEEKDGARWEGAVIKLK